MYRVYNKLLPAHIMSYFKTINACHNHNVRMKNCNLKIWFSRTNKKSECISVKGPKLWNDLSADIKLGNSMFTFKKCKKLYFCNLINLINAFVLLTGNDYLLPVT